MVTPLHKVKFAPPASWLDVSVVAFTAGGDGYSENVVLSSEPLEGQNLVAFASDAIEDLKAMSDDYRQLRREPATFNGLKGELVEHSFVDEDVQVRQLQFFFASGEDGFTLSVTYPAERATELESTFRSVAESLSVA